MKINKVVRVLKVLAILIAALAGVLILLCTGSHFVVEGRAKAKEKKIQAIYLKEKITGEEILADIVWYEKMYETLHPAQIPTFPLGNIKEKMASLSSSIDKPITRLDFFRLLAPIISSIHDEHTTILLPNYELSQHEEKNGLFFPFEVFFINDRLYIKNNLSANKQIKAGMEILSINAVQTEDIKKTLMNYFSGSRDAQKIFYLQEHFKDALFIGYGAVENFTLEIKELDRRTTVTHKVPGLALKREKMQPFYYQILNKDTALFTYNLFEDPENTFDTFLKDLFTTLKKKNIKNLIIDLRRNKGGATFLGDSILSYIGTEPYSQFSRLDVTVSDEARKAFLSEVPGFLRWFPIQYFHPLLKPLWAADVGETASLSFEKSIPAENALTFKGNLYVIIGPGSMSSATLFPSTIKKYKMGTLIGESTGGLDTCYGNVTTYRLPASALEIEMPGGVVYGNTTGTIAPDHRVKQTVKDLQEGKDTVIEYILNIKS